MYIKEILSNKIRLLIIPMPALESVSVQVFVRVGGRDESFSNAGISHFLEHTVFKGTKKRPSMGAISQEVEKIGGHFNAGTGEEYTMYYVKVPKERIETAFDVLSDSLFNSLFKKEALDKERQVIIEEINVYEDMPMYKVQSVFDALLFPNHPLGFDLAGTKESVATIQREDLIAYMRQFYLANNMVLAVAGNVDAERVKKLANQYFGNAQQEAIPPIQSYVDTQDSPKLSLHTKKTDQTHLCLGFKVFGADSPDRFKLTVLNTVLGGGASSRLFASIREKEGLCYYISSDVDLYFETGVWHVRAGVDNKRVLRAVKLIMDELMKIRNSRVTKKELTRAKEFLKGGLKLSLESSDAQGGFYASQEILKNSILSVEEICEKIDAVTSDELLDLARKLITNEKLNLALVGPFENQEDFKKLLHIKESKTNQ